MADTLSIFNRSDDEQAAQSAPATPFAPDPMSRIQPQSNLFPCPDCTHRCSRQAESCPQCGRFFQRFAQTIEISRAGWSVTVAWGVILAWILATLIALVVFVILLILGVAIGSSGSSPQPVIIPNSSR